MGILLLGVLRAAYPIQVVSEPVVDVHIERGVPCGRGSSRRKDRERAAIQLSVVATPVRLKPRSNKTGSMADNIYDFREGLGLQGSVGSADFGRRIDSKLGEYVLGRIDGNELNAAAF